MNTTNDVKPLARLNSDSDQKKVCARPCYWQREGVGGCLLGNDLPGCEKYCKRDYRPPVRTVQPQEAVT